jgi:hypothetical protein
MYNLLVSRWQHFNWQVQNPYLDGFITFANFRVDASVSYLYFFVNFLWTTGLNYALLPSCLLSAQASYAHLYSWLHHPGTRRYIYTWMTLWTADLTPSFLTVYCHHKYRMLTLQLTPSPWYPLLHLHMNDPLDGWPYALLPTCFLSAQVSHAHLYSWLHHPGTRRYIYMWTTLLCSYTWQDWCGSCYSRWHPPCIRLCLKKTNASLNDYVLSNMKIKYRDYLLTPGPRPSELYGLFILCSIDWYRTQLHSMGRAFARELLEKV